MALSLSGRDAGEIFLVINVSKNGVEVVNGSTRKIGSPKLKNAKHLQKVYAAPLFEIAEQINKGLPVGNDRLKRAIKAAKKD